MEAFYAQALRIAAPGARPQKVDLGELRKRALDTTADTKEKLPLVKLATFGGKRSEQNSLRHNANVESITGVEGDYDDETVPFDKAVELIRQSRLNALLYTSPSNTADKPRWRILCPASQPQAPEERVKLVARVNIAELLKVVHIAVPPNADQQALNRGLTKLVRLWNEGKVRLLVLGEEE
jgi:hypothetical protein